MEVNTVCEIHYQMVARQAGAKVEKLGNTSECENDALVKKLAEWLADVEVETLGERKTKKENEAKVGTRTDREEEVEVETLSYTVPKLEAKRLLDTLSERLAETQALPNGC